MLILDFSTLDVAHEMVEHDEIVTDVTYSPDGEYFASASYDQMIYLYRASQEYELLYCLTGNSSSVEHLLFSSNSAVLASNSKDNQMLFYEVQTGARVTRQSKLRDLDWDQWTLKMGWHAMGVWDPGYDLTDVNATCQSNAGDTLALADDYGQVKLFKFPCAVQHTAACAAYPGHSSHVTCVRFLADDSKLISTGGRDTAVFQWVFQQGVPPEVRHTLSPLMLSSSPYYSPGHPTPGTMLPSLSCYAFPILASCAAPLCCPLVLPPCPSRAELSPQSRDCKPAPNRRSRT